MFPKDVVINEIVASNDSTSKIFDSAKEADDWIELYNNTSNKINLSGLYHSKSEDNIKKWKFPIGTIIEPNGYLTIWADKDEKQRGLHCNFKLSKKGNEQKQLAPVKFIITR